MGGANIRLQGVSVLLCALAWGLSAACSTRTDARLADLVEADGAVERQPREAGSWSAARVGDGFTLGSALRTGPAAGAVLMLRGGGRLRVVASSTIRFSSKPGRPFRLEVDTGAVEIEATGEPLEIETSLGTARLERGGAARLFGTADGARLQILVGDAVIERGDQRVALRAGDEIGVELGDAQLEPVYRAAPDAGPRAAPPVVAVPPSAPGAPIATQVHGRHAQIETEHRWEALPEGASTVAAGTRVRVGERTTVELVRGDEQALVTGAAEVVVGGADGADGALVDAVRGKVTFTSRDHDVRIVVPGGAIVARGGADGSTADVEVDGKGKKTSVTARRGAIEVTAGGATETLHGGESVDVHGNGRIADVDRAPTRVDFSLASGDRVVVVHDPSPPTAVRVPFGGLCTGEGALEIVRAKRDALLSVGAGGANVRLAKGSHRFRVRCLTAGEPDAAARSEGKLTILRDSGRTTLPRRPPANVVDADGRPYLVVYQNLLPDLTFRWPKAPAAKGYTLHVEPKRGAKIVLQTVKPSHACLSGQLAEGDYTYWYEAAGGASSPKTRLTIEYDNAAATASIRSAAATEAGALRIEGTVLPGWSVTAGGQAVSVDRAGRFTVELRPAEGEDAVAIRLEHPDRGVHYYVMRPAKR